MRTDDATGELQVRTPALSAGYADGTDLGDRLTDDGWFRTGDVGHVDDDGFVWIDGRLSDMINRGGLKVFPAEVEEVLRLSPDVADVAVVGVPDDRLGEVPWAFVVRRDGAPDDADARGAVPRAPGALQGAGPLRGGRRAAPQRGRQGADPRPRRPERCGGLGPATAGTGAAAVLVEHRLHRRPLHPALRRDAAQCGVDPIPERPPASTRELGEQRFQVRQLVVRLTGEHGRVRLPQRAS